MDDGSRSLEESLRMLSALKEQGISTVVATPHFYANEGSVENFLQRRSESISCLSKCLTEMHPQVLCGAEVAYYPGIAKLKDLKTLTIENTDLLLLEMPVSKWTDTIVNEIIELSVVRGVKIVLAHVERYISLQSKTVLNKILSSGILMQMNASFFRGFFDGHKAISLIKSGRVHFVGSDCHNMTSRKPRISMAYELIRKKCGESFIRQMNSYGHQLLKV